MAALSVDRASAGMNTGIPSRAPRAAASLRRRLFAANALRTQLLRRAKRPVDQALDDHTLKTCAEIGHFLPRERPCIGRDVESARDRDASSLEQTRDCGLQT